MGDVNVMVQNTSRSAPTNVTDNWTAAAAGNNYLIPNDGNTRIVFNNAGGAPITATLQTPNAVDDNAIADKALTITNGKTYVSPPWPPSV